MSIERVKAYLDQYGLADRIREFEASSATVELAARAAGVEPPGLFLRFGHRIMSRVGMGHRYWRSGNTRFAPRLTRPAL